MPTHLDLFSGIGGFALAAGWAGYTTIGFSEIDSYASAVLAHHWPAVPNHGDIRTVPAIPCDLITGGFPCQPFSCVGQRTGKSDSRYLWPEMCRVISECKPSWVLSENVPEFDGVALDDMLADLEGLGYETCTLEIPACGVGAPHKRRRLWIVAYGSRNRRQDVAREDGQPNSHGRASSGVDPVGGGDLLANTHGEPLERLAVAWPQRDSWAVEPKLDRVAYGVPHRVDRLRCLGNAIVPQVAYELLRLMPCS